MKKQHQQRKPFPCQSISLPQATPSFVEMKKQHQQLLLSLMFLVAVAAAAVAADPQPEQVCLLLF
jgi:hypothetical protein